ncbi:cupin domain-containing protein [Streptomyces sp. NPDC096057]|uniref:cupin domain-containing protein n=1 Tax=Streptomyces sp. NPDC096057 TaxID=3155543 RepID=UPI003321097D
MSIPLVRNPGEGTIFKYYDRVQEQVVSNSETQGAVSVVRVTMRQADAPPLHTHSREDESWVVLSGRVRFWVGSASLDECEIHDAEAGAYVFGPRFVPHTCRPLSKTADLLVINNPGAVEGYFRSIGPADAPHDLDHADLMVQYGLTVLAGPPPA